MSKKSNKLLITGNEAIALGAIKAGLKFYAAYPMTPATSILHFLAGHEHQYKIIVKQTEDEIAAMNMAIGASVAGARGMTATSGGGFALMTEALGLSAMIETPIVAAVVSRPGPATGMPTWTAQGDLRFVMHAAPDEFPRIILSPGDALEAYQLTFKAFNLADKYQIPVLILSDKLLAESYFTVLKSQMLSKADSTPLPPALSFRRAGMAAEFSTPPMAAASLKRHKTNAAAPTMGRVEKQMFNSDEHDEFGYSEEDSQNRINQMNKRMKKLDAIVKDRALDLPRWYGPKEADLTLICWGSSKAVCQEVMNVSLSKELRLKPFKNADSQSSIKFKSSDFKRLKPKFLTLNLLHFNHIYPIDVAAVKKELAKIKRSICVEGNFSGQFADYLFEKTGYRVNKKLSKYDGRPWFVEELAAKIFNF